MGHVPLYDDSAPIVCTITDQEVPDRLALLERMRTNLTAIEPSEHGLVLHFPIRDEVEADIRRFAADEKRCCEFWGFEVTKAPDELILRWDGPPRKP